MQVAVVVSKQEVGDFNALAHVFVHFGLGILQIGKVVVVELHHSYIFHY